MGKQNVNLSKMQQIMTFEEKSWSKINNNIKNAKRAEKYVKSI